MDWDESKDSLTHTMWSDLEDTVLNVSAAAAKISRRYKRAVDDEPEEKEADVQVDSSSGLGDYVRHGADCLSRQQQLADANMEGTARWGSALHVVVMVEEMEEARMTCHYCDSDEEAGKEQTEEEKDVQRAAKIWYQLKRKEKKGHYKIKEVDLDMHDDPSRNRVYVTETHTLIVKDATVKDAGTYFCRDNTDKDQYFNEKMTEEDLATFFKPWTACSVCDKPGTRRRLGECTVFKLNVSRQASPLFLDVVLSSFRQGIPCLSSVFEGHETLRDIVSRPDEIEEEECEVSCANYTVETGDLVSGPVEGKIKEKNFKEREGMVIVLKCPHAPVDVPVAWLNGSKVLVGPWLKDSTNGRVSIDEHNVLTIHSISLYDAGHYACIYGRRVRGRMRLEVTPKPKLSKTFRYAYYLLMTYPFDFVVFLVLLVVRHNQRKKVLNYDLLPDMEYNSGSESGSEGSDDEKKDDKSDASDDDK
ncbi:uncharacterized protein LOC131941055 [Physella acuta]|uniref:uncharacterized protein LOC131941055 n=1 Tax=Physella acuta TaxID=109671 RepID=UPI0027DACA42|nr:uncharacterized protein LOC131941055 [Physella acuta]